MAEIERKHGRVEPRSWVSLFFGHKGWLALIGLLVLLVLTFTSVRALIKAEQFESEGIAARAEITSKRTRRSGDDNIYYVTYSFKPDRGALVIKERKVGSSYYRKAIVGGSVPIRYLQADPAGFEYYIGENRFKKRIYQILALLSGLGGLGVLWIAGQSANMAVLARRYGKAGVGEVMSVIEGKDSDGDPTGKGQLVWRDEAGRRSVGMDHDLGLLKRYKRGDKIRIFMRDGKSWWEGDVGPRKLR